MICVRCNKTTTDRFITGTCLACQIKEDQESDRVSRWVVVVLFLVWVPAALIFGASLVSKFLK